MNKEQAKQKAKDIVSVFSVYHTIHPTGEESSIHGEPELIEVITEALLEASKIKMPSEEDIEKQQLNFAKTVWRVGYVGEPSEKDIAQFPTLGRVVRDYWLEWHTQEIKSLNNCEGV